MIIDQRDVLDIPSHLNIRGNNNAAKAALQFGNAFCKIPYTNLSRILQLISVLSLFDRLNEISVKKVYYTG